MRLLNFNIIRLFLFLVLGILIGRFSSVDIRSAFIGCLILLSSTAITWYFNRNKLTKHALFAVLSYLTMISIGCVTYLSHIDSHKDHHYSKLVELNNSKELILQIKQRLKPDQYNEKYIASIISINGKSTFGKLLVNIKSDSLNKPLNVDTVFFISEELRPIQGPLNPYQFDYSAYLEDKNIYRQVYVNQTELKQISNKPFTIFGYADALRKTINERLVNAGFKPDTLGIINAMLLGQRQDIDKDIYNNYINSGTIHILAVSGLHVGIILLILNALFKPLLYLKHGRVLRPAIIVLLLWLFAIIAGLSPSVTRAVTMFSIISIAMHLKRPTNIYNTLVISAFLILLIQPNFLFQVGFQMSYAAVLGIVSIQPKLYKLISSNYWPIDKLWQIFTVTLAAQIGVLPISLYYFHQFPGLFFISNLVVIPVLGLILGMGLLVIISALANTLPHFLVELYSSIIESLNAFTAWVANFEAFLFRDISFNLIQVICWYILIICIVTFYSSKKSNWLILGLISILSLQCYTFYNSITQNKKSLVVFNKSRYTLIGIQNQKHLNVYHNLDSSKLLRDNIVKNFTVGERITSIKSKDIASVYRVEKENLLVIDSLGVYENLSFNTPYILLRNSPKINLNRLVDSLNPRTIIADASNYTSYVKRWKSTCTKRKVEFHYTKEKGAFILR